MKMINPADAADRRELVGGLRRGGVAVIPTDTLFGFSALISSKSAHQRIAALKHSDQPRRFVYLASGADQVSDYVGSWGCTTREYLAGIWPAPLTAILPAGGRCPEWVGDTIAIRVPEMELVRKIAQLAGEPMVSTSVNVTGTAPINDLAEIGKQFADVVDFAVASPKSTPASDKAAATDGDHRPSTLVDFCGDSPKLIRAGSYAWSAGANPSN